MLDCLLAGLLSLAPQDDPAAGTAAPAPAAAVSTTAPERWLPADTLAAVILSPLPSGAVLDDLLAQPELQPLVALAQTLAQQPAPLPMATLATALRNGAAFGWLGVDRALQPKLLLVAALGEAKGAVTAALADLPTAGGKGELRMAGTGKARFFLAVRDDHLAAGTVPETVVAALERVHTPARNTLADEQSFTRSLPASQDQRLLHCYLRIDAMLSAIKGLVPALGSERARTALHAIGVDRMQWASASWQLAGNQVVANYQLDCTEVPGLLDALAGATGRLDAGLARAVPPGATGYGFFAVDLGTVFDQITAIATAIEPGGDKAMQAALARIEARTGLDARAVVFGSLNGRIVTASLPTGDFGVLVELKQGAAYAKSLARLVPALPVQLQPGTCAGVPCWRVRTADPDAPTPAFAVVGDWLVLGGTDAALTTLVQSLAQPQPDAQTQEFLRALPPETTWACQGTFAMPGPLPAELRTPLAGAGPRRATLTRNESTLGLETRIDARDLVRTAAALANLAAGRFQGARRQGQRPAVEGSDPAAVAALQAAEQAGATAECVPAVEQMLEHADAKIAARAAWLLGEWKVVHSSVALGNAATRHPSMTVRLQAMQSLTKVADETALEQVTAASMDGDRQLRTLAVQALARIGTPVAMAAVLAVLDKYREVEGKTVPSDLVAALVVLHDHGEPANLLPAASAIDCTQPQVAQALTFLFQGLSPKLPPKDEAQTLLAVLDHKEPMLRRYAIQRLGELRDATTVRALEGRLGKEGPELQPLVRVSLAQVRGEVQKGGDDLVDRAKTNVSAIAQMVGDRWTAMDRTARIVVIGLAGFLVGTVLLLLVLRRRAHREAHAAAAAALVSPSAGYVPRTHDTARPPRQLAGTGNPRDHH